MQLFSQFTDGETEMTLQAGDVIQIESGSLAFLRGSTRIILRQSAGSYKLNFFLKFETSGDFLEFAELIATAAGLGIETTMGAWSCKLVRRT